MAEPEEQPLQCETGQDKTKVWPLALEACSRRARTEAPIFLICLAIGSQCVEIRSNDRGDRSSLSLPGNLARRRLALAQHFLKAFDRNRQADLVPISETIGDRLGGAEDLHGHPQRVGFQHFP